MDDLIQEFLAETNESLAALDSDIVKLEQNPNDKDLISRIFRLVHTIKGTCGFLALPRLEKVAHHSENVLGRYREGSLQITEESVSLILEAFDRIKSIVADLGATGAEPQGDDADLIQRLDIVYEGIKGPASTMPPPVFPSFPAAPPAAPAAPIEAAPPPAPIAPSAPPPPAPPPAEAVHPAPAEAMDKDTDKKTAAIAAEDAATKTLRVSVDVLENLMTMVSELVLTRNQLLQIMRSQTDSPFTAPLQRLNHVVSELQEGVMQTRMQPIGNAWSKLPRIVRDISVELNKKIALDMLGNETELDRQVLDLIKDPLTHMVRNSADHGIEDPKARIAAGKPEEGRIRLNAFHEGGHIIIEIADDGKGLNVDAIRRKALEKGVATEEQMRNMTEKQIQQFIFAAGFSTAEKVTSVSGRGVGMDVVRTNIEKIGGTIEMNSVQGKGTTFTIKIPLTLAIVSALIVEAGNERYAVPQISVRELVRLSRKGDNRLEEIHGTPVMRLRDRLLPLISLRKILKMEEDKDQSNQVIVVQVGAHMFGITVDRVFDTEEIVVKPVSPILKHIRIFSGNTILGDGSVIMILDPNGMAAMVGDISTSRADQEKEEEEQKAAWDADRTSLLVFKAGEGAPRAVPLALVSRLEEVKVDEMEVSGNQRVVQYRGRLMPLIPFSDRMSMKEAGDKQSVLVFTDRDRSMGLMVDSIVDIVEERIDVQLTSDNNFGILGSAIIHGKAMDVIDVGHFLSLAHSDWFGHKTGVESHIGTKRLRILLVDDSPFFRNMLSPMLGVAGYQVSTVDSAQEALSLCQSGEQFDVIVSDIEMPGMSGFEFAKAVREKDGNWSKVPLLALSSHASAGDLDRGRAAGFDDYIAKFDREALLRSIAHLGVTA